MALLSGWLLLVAAGAACAGQHPGEQGVAPGIVPEPQQQADSEILREVMPPVPRSAGPSEASPTGGSAERPPHPAIPAPLQEPEPTAETLAATSYRWLPGHWIWTGNQYEWQSGLWIYDVPGYALVPPKWLWDGYEWLFVDAGWALPGTSRVAYRPTPVPRDAPDGLGRAALQSSATPDVYVEARSYAVYSWPGYWIAPPIVYPLWHPYYHYYWHHHHSAHAPMPLYRDGRYDYARRHSDPSLHFADEQRQAWARSNRRPESQTPVRPVIPNTVRTRVLSASHLEARALRKPEELDPAALQATPEQRAIREQADFRRPTYGVPLRSQDPRRTGSADDPRRPPPANVRPILPAAAGSYGAPRDAGRTRRQAQSSGAQAPREGSTRRPSTSSTTPPALSSSPRPTLSTAPRTEASAPPPAATPTSNRPSPSISRPRRPTPPSRPSPSGSSQRATPPPTRSLPGRSGGAAYPASSTRR